MNKYLLLGPVVQMLSGLRTRVIGSASLKYDISAEMPLEYAFRRLDRF